VARKKNPYGDPVSVYRKGKLWRVRYYPTGLIGEPGDRKELSNSFHSRESADRAADLLRRSLLEHRDIYGPRSNKSYSPLADALTTYVAELKKGMASQAIPAGTAAGRISDLTLALKEFCRTRDFRVRDLTENLARAIITKLSVGQGRNGGPIAANTVRKRKVSLKKFRDLAPSQRLRRQAPIRFPRSRERRGPDCNESGTTHARPRSSQRRRLLSRRR
jgi:hypothetical protein